MASVGSSVRHDRASRPGGQALHGLDGRRQLDVVRLAHHYPVRAGRQHEQLAEGYLGEKDRGAVHAVAHALQDPAYGVQIVRDAPVGRLAQNDQLAADLQVERPGEPPSDDDAVRIALVEPGPLGNACRDGADAGVGPHVHPLQRRTGRRHARRRRARRRPAARSPGSPPPRAPRSASRRHRCACRAMDRPGRSARGSAGRRSRRRSPSAPCRPAGPGAWRTRQPWRRSRTPSRPP